MQVPPYIASTGIKPPWLSEVVRGRGTFTELNSLTRQAHVTGPLIVCVHGICEYVPGKILYSASEVFLFFQR